MSVQPVDSSSVDFSKDSFTEYSKIDALVLAILQRKQENAEAVKLLNMRSAYFDDKKELVLSSCALPESAYPQIMTHIEKLLPHTPEEWKDLACLLARTNPDLAFDIALQSPDVANTSAEVIRSVAVTSLEKAKELLFAFRMSHQNTYKYVLQSLGVELSAQVLQADL